MKTTRVRLTTGTRELPLPIRLVSDWHLGHPGSRVRSIAQVEHLLEEVGTLVMVGDGREELVADWRSRADGLWRELQAACERRGVVFVVLTGNHDPGASGEGWMSLRDGRILVTHGDMVYDTASPWSKELFVKRAAIAQLLEERSSLSLEDRWRCAQAVGELLQSHRKMEESFIGYVRVELWPPQRLWEIVRVWAGFAKEGARFLERFSPETEILICGHFHRSGKFKIGRKTVWNTGSLMKMSQGLAIDFDGKNLHSHRVKLAKTEPHSKEAKS